MIWLGHIGMTFSNRSAELLRWLLAIALAMSLAEPVSTWAGSVDGDMPTSILDLQRLVDHIIVEKDDQANSDSATSVLDLQHALLKTIRSDAPPQGKEPTRQDNVVLPSPPRFHFPASPGLLRAFEECSAHRGGTLGPLAAEHLPISAGARVRYRFHLLANAPPKQADTQVI